MKKRLIAFLLVIALLLPACTALAATYYRVNTTWLRAHTQPKMSAKVVDSYRRDFAATILKTYKGGWAKVRFLPGNHVAYVQKKYLAAASSSYTAYLSKDHLNVRTGPAPSFKSLGRLNGGAKVTVLTHGAKYDYVSTPRGKGYIDHSALTRSKPAGLTAFVRNPRNRTVNLRSGPGLEYKVIDEYRPGTKVIVYEKDDEWCYVKVQGKWGYMMTYYLSFE